MAEAARIGQIGDGDGNGNVPDRQRRRAEPSAVPLHRFPERDVPGFDGTSYGDQPAVPDDVIEDGERLFDVVADFVDAANKPLAFRDAFVAVFEGKLKAANKEWSEAEAADAKYQGLLSEVRDTAETFDRELQGFRKTLSAAFGRSDKDFQKLRASRAQGPDEEDDPVAPPTPPPVTPAGPGVSGPTG